MPEHAAFPVDITTVMDEGNKSSGGEAPRNAAGVGAFVEAMRVSHWIKNVFVAAPILFAGKLAEARAWGECLAAVTAFCLLSSAVYLINDVCDRSGDRAHPVKCRRPVASGRLSVSSALAGAGVLSLCGLGIVAAVGASTFDRGKTLMGLGVLLWAGAYLALNVLYSLWLKRYLIVDVIVVAFGFVLRAMAGAAAIAAPISPWLVVCTFTLCLFIALTKRRSEIAELPAEVAGEARAVNSGYDRLDIEHMLTVSAALAILTYSLYCLAPGTVRRIDSAHMVWTIPLVIYGIFRYSRVTRRAGRNDPVKALVRDRVMWFVVAAYAVLTALVLRFGSHPVVRDILHVDFLVR